MSTTKPTVMGGKLKLKGSDSSIKKKRKADKISAEVSASTVVEGGDDTVDKAKPPAVPESHLTEAQKRYLKRKEEIDSRAIKSVIGMSYRDRVDTFNQKLNTMTEHNDIPRVSAAGNG
jgi:protein FAM32A